MCWNGIHPAQMIGQVADPHPNQNDRHHEHRRSPPPEIENGPRAASHRPLPTGLPVGCFRGSECDHCFFVRLNHHSRFDSAFTSLGSALPNGRDLRASHVVSWQRRKTKKIGRPKEQAYRDDTFGAAMKDIEQMAATIHRHRDEDHETIRTMLAALRVPDAVEVLNAVPSLEEAAEVLTLIPLQRAIEVCNQPTLYRRGALLEQLPPELAAKILDGMASDERTAAVREMCDHGRRLLLPLLNSSARQEVEDQLKYPPHTAGEMMTTEFVRLVPTMTVSQALERIREVVRHRESIYACYVVEPRTDRLLGAVSLRDLVVANAARPVSEVMRSNPVTVGALEPRKNAVQKISKYNLLAVPVLEQDGRVVGFVTVDDAIDSLVEEQTDTVLRMGAVEAGALDEPYMASPWQLLVKKRASWLVLLFLGEMLTATAMGHFEDEIARRRPRPFCSADYLQRRKFRLASDVTVDSRSHWVKCG